MRTPTKLGPSIGMLVVAAVATGGAPALAQAPPDPATPTVEFVTAEELKARLARGEPVTIIDVRAGGAYAGDDERIMGAIGVRPRRLRSRLSYAPLKDLPRDREVVTYCACPEDQAAIRAAQVLLKAGFKRARALKGGWEAWVAAGGPVERRPSSGS